jgi:outer membrane biosynthesis protein TonB
MTEDDNSKLVDMDNLDTFEKHFFELEDSDDKEDEVDETEDDSLATDDDEDADEEEIETPSEDEDEDEEDDPEEDKKPEPKPKSKAQKRIEELVTEARVAQRERDAEKRERELLERRLAEVEARSEVKDDKTVRDQLPPEAPNPDATDEKGEAVYIPLGSSTQPLFVILLDYDSAGNSKGSERGGRKRCCSAVGVSSERVD